MNQPTNQTQGASVEDERAEFEAWWEDEGQYIRAGGGDYEKCFAYGAWQAARRTQPAGAGAPSIDTPEFRKLIQTLGPTLRHLGSEYAEVVAHIDAHLARQGAAPAPAQVEPVAWIRFRSDGGYEGPIMDATMEEVRKKSGAWTPLGITATAPAQAGVAQADEEKLRALLEAEFDCYRTSAGLIPWAINALLDNSPHRAAPTQPAAPAWSKEPPTEQADYWHWDGDEDHAPMIYHVLWSGSANKCFVSIGQYDIREAIWCDKFGGWWMKIKQPRIPPHSTATEGAQRCKCGNTIDVCAVTSCENAMDTGLNISTATEGADGQGGAA